MVTCLKIVQEFHGTSVRFRAWQDTLRRDLKKPAANLGEFAGRFWSQIWDETYCVDKMDKESLGADVT